MSGKNKQRYDVMMARDYEVNGEQRTQWTKLGAAFMNQNGSIGVQLDAIPMTGKLVLVIPMTEEERKAKYGERDQQEREERGRQQRRRGGGPKPMQQALPQYPSDWDDAAGPDTSGGGGFADDM